MITLTKPISLPRGLYIEYMPDYETLNSDAMLIVEQVALMAMIVTDKEPDDRAIANLMYRLLVVGYLCVALECHEPVLIQTVVNKNLDTTFDGLPKEIWEMTMGKIPVPREIAGGLKEFLRRPVAV